MRKTELRKEISAGELKITRKRTVKLAALVDEETYKAAFESAGDVILLIDKIGKIMDVNNRLKAIGGYEKDELVGKNIKTLAAIMTAKSKARINKNFLKRMTGVNVLPYEVEIYKKNRELMTIEISARPLKKAGKIIGDLVIMRDVTESKRIEKKLKISEENYRNLMDNSVMGIRIRDQEDILYMNQAFLDIFGYKNSEEAILTPPVKLYTPESYADYVLRAEKIARGEPVSNNIEVSIKRKDGTIRHLQVFGKRVIRNGKEQGQTLYNDITERKQAEQLYYTLAESSRGSVYIAQNGKFVFTNSVFQKNIGYTADELLLMGPAVLVYPADTEMVRDSAVQMLKGTRQQPYMFRVVTKSGEIRWALETVTSITYNGKRAILGNFMDVTERRQAEEKLEQLEQNFRNSMDNSSIGIRISDINDKNLYANRAMLDIFGYKNLDEIQTTPPQEYYSPEAYANWLERHEKRLRGEPMPKQVEIDIIRKDGTVRYLDVSMMDVFWDGKKQYQTLYNDITERKKVEKALHESEEKYRLIVENSTDIIFTLNGRGEFIYLSPSIKNVLGYNQNDLIGVSFRSLVHPDDIHVIDEAIQSHHIDGALISSEREYRFRHASGEWRWHISTGTPMREKNEEVFNFVGVARDITKRRQADGRIEQAAREWRTTFDSITDLISIHDKDNRFLRVNKARSNARHQ
jgi:PAS domain S-box-containing protein